MHIGCSLDGLDDKTLFDTVVNFVKNAQEPRLTIEEIDHYYGTITPRSVFFKNLPKNAELLDLGAGDGTMVAFRDWPIFKRQDIGMYAVSLDLGAQFARWNGYELLNFEEKFPDFGKRPFDAILCAHFIEHLKDPARCIRWISQRLQAGGRLYLEWPHSLSKQMPTNTVVRSLGLSVSTINFFDDSTHIETWEMEAICDILRQYGLITELIGRTHYPFLANELRNTSKKTGDQVHGTFAVWSFSGWAQYIVASKP